MCLLINAYRQISTKLEVPIIHKIDHTQVNLIQLKTFELELDFAKYIQHTDVRIADLCWALYIHVGLPSTG